MEARAGAATATVPGSADKAIRGRLAATRRGARGHCSRQNVKRTTDSDSDAARSWRRDAPRASILAWDFRAPPAARWRRSPRSMRRSPDFAPARSSRHAFRQSPRRDDGRATRSPRASATPGAPPKRKNRRSPPAAERAASGSIKIDAGDAFAQRAARAARCQQDADRIAERERGRGRRARGNARRAARTSPSRRPSVTTSAGVVSVRQRGDALDRFVATHRIDAATENPDRGGRRITPAGTARSAGARRP